MSQCHSVTHLGHVIEKHQNNGGEQKHGGYNQEEDVAQIEEPLVLCRSPVPGAQGHHAGPSYHRHLEGFSDGWLRWKTLKVKFILVLHNMAAWVGSGSDGIQQPKATRNQGHTSIRYQYIMYNRLYYRLYLIY